LSLGLLSGVAFGVGLGVGNRSSKQYREGPTDRDIATDRGRAANASAVAFGTLAGALIVTGTTLLIVKYRRQRSPTTLVACISRGSAGSARCRRRM
jgi:ABC-type nitrate/sulfonate/bicarbonate transport system substrate-binding protein